MSAPEAEILCERGDSECGFPDRFFINCVKCGKEIEGEKLASALELVRTQGDASQIDGDGFICQCGAEYVGTTRLPVLILITETEGTKEEP